MKDKQQLSKESKFQNQIQKVDENTMKVLQQQVNSLTTSSDQWVTDNGYQPLSELDLQASSMNNNQLANELHNLDHKK